MDNNIIAENFIQYYYNKWLTNTDELYNNGLITNYTKFKYDKKEYIGNDFILFLKETKNININILKFDIVDSKSRNIYIMVIGKINDNNFSQSFNMIYNGKKNDKSEWSIINSILILN
jgi:hypothetical protein